MLIHYKLTIFTKNYNMKSIISIAIIIFSITTVIAQHNCYTIAVGKNITDKQNTVYLAHNEDDSGDLIINMFKVGAKTFAEKDSFQLTNGQNIPQVKNVNSLLWLETTQQNFSDMFMNEFGVTICSNSCPSREYKANGILNYDFRRLIAERAKTAKQAVKIAGELLQKYGYESSGRSYTIADTDEIWILAVVKGNHWVAQRVPNNQVVIIPNYYTIGEINLKDTANFLATADIINYAIERGWYNPKLGKPFNFRQAYSARRVLHASWNVPRHWAGLNLLAEKQFGIDDEFPFSFTPKSKVSIDDLKKVLDNHYEGTDLEANHLLHKNPHKNLNHPICNTSTKFSVIAELNSTTKTLWWAPLNPCIFPYVPINFDIKEIPKMYSNIGVETAKANHFLKQENSYKANPNHAFTVFDKYKNSINSNYWNNKNKRESFKNKFEKKVKSETDSYKILIELYDEVKKLEE